MEKVLHQEKTLLVCLNTHTLLIISLKLPCKSLLSSVKVIFSDFLFFIGIDQWGIINILLLDGILFLDVFHNFAVSIYDFLFLTFSRR